MIAYDGGIKRAVILYSESGTAYLPEHFLIHRLFCYDHYCLARGYFQIYTHKERKKELKCGRIVHSVGDFSKMFFVKKYLVCDSTLKLETVGNIKQIGGCILRIFVRIPSFNNGCQCDFFICKGILQQNFMFDRKVCLQLEILEAKQQPRFVHKLFCCRCSTWAFNTSMSRLTKHFVIFLLIIKPAYSLH